MEQYKKTIEEISDIEVNEKKNHIEDFKISKRQKKTTANTVDEMGADMSSPEKQPSTK